MLLWFKDCPVDHALLPSLEQVDVVELVEVHRGFDGGLHLGDESRDQLLKIRVTSSID